MFWNKNKIPSYTIKTDEYDNLENVVDEDLFFYDDEDNVVNLDRDVYRVNNNTVDLFNTSDNVSRESDDSLDDENSKNIDIEVNDNDNEELKSNIDGEVIEQKISFANKFVSVLLVATLFLGLMIFIDVVCVSRFNVGPFFAIRTKVVDDGGSRIYHGLGYKVIKYNQTGGRCGLVLGSWNLKYSTDAIDTSMFDLAIDFNSGKESSYLNQFVKVKGEILSSDNSSITLIYLDDGGKYTTKLICEMADGYKKDSISDSKVISVVGTIYDVDSEKAKVIKMRNCYVR